MVCHSDCRHVCDDEGTDHDDLDENDHVHEDHDDQCSASSSEACRVLLFPLSLYNMFVFRVFFSLRGVAASSLVGLYDLVLVSVSKPARQKQRRKSISYLLFCLIIPCWVAGILVRARAFLGTSRS